MMGRPVLLIYLLVEWYNLFPISVSVAKKGIAEFSPSPSPKLCRVSVTVAVSNTSKSSLICLQQSLTCVDRCLEMPLTRPHVPIESNATADLGAEVIIRHPGYEDDPDPLIVLAG